MTENTRHDMKRDKVRADPPGIVMLTVALFGIALWAATSAYTTVAWVAGILGVLTLAGWLVARYIRRD